MGRDVARPSGPAAAQRPAIADDLPGPLPVPHLRLDASTAEAIWKLNEEGGVLPGQVEEAFGAASGCKAFLLEVRGTPVAGESGLMDSPQFEALRDLGYLN